jgi:hypothetical protein
MPLLYDAAMITALLLLVLAQSGAAEPSGVTPIPEQKIVNSSVESVFEPLPVIEVRSQRYILNSEIDSSLSSLSEKEIRAVAPKHPNEIFSRVPGAWISSGSGQEHLTAIRSPVLTGAGACGAFMVLEDDVPTRPSGFCNVNQLFEVKYQAGRPNRSATWSRNGYLWLQRTSRCYRCTDTRSDSQDIFRIHTGSRN